nr:coproporphyrinogen-III oxidase family protein [Candidatus Krumholzibacteria bacterium]
MTPRDFGLYIHVPFCGAICSYCHFVRTAQHDLDLRTRWVEGARREMDLWLEHCPSLTSGTRQLATAYLGGGTPSQLEPDLMTRLITGTVDRLAHGPDLELTAEANPESLNSEKVKAWRAAGINRISLGVQSLDRGVLDLLGRACDPATARRGLGLATEGFARVSADWIIGPGLVQKNLLAELSEAVDLGVTHFSLYILEVHEGTALARDVHDGRLALPPDSHTEALYLAAGEHLEQLGIAQYEVANFALPGHESRHNRAYWQGRPWLALGPGAHGAWGRRRHANLAGISDWLNAVEQGQLPVGEIDPLDRAARRLEKAILALRTREGLPLAWIPQGTFELDRGEREGLWDLLKGKLVLTRKGFLRIDSLEERLVQKL